MARALTLGALLPLLGCFHGQSFTHAHTVSTWRAMQPTSPRPSGAPTPTTPTAGEPLTVEQAYALALTNSPDLAATDARAEVAEAGIQSARQLDNPQLRLTNFDIDEAVAGQPGMNIGLRVPIPRPGTIHAKVEAARRGAEGQRGLAEDARRQLWARIRKLYARMAALHLDLEQQTRASALRGGQRDELGARQSRSIATDLDVALAGVTHAQALDEGDRIRDAIAGIERELQALIRASEPPRLQLDPGELEPHDLDLDRDRLTERAMAGRPELMLARSAVEQARSGVYLARSKAYPWFDWAQVQYRAGSTAIATGAPSTAFSFGLAMTLPAFSLNRGEIRASRALVRQREAEERARIAAVASEVDAIIGRVRRTARRLHDLETGLLPQIDAATRAAAAALAAGALDPLTASAVTTRMIDARRTHIAALLEHREAVIDLEAAIAGPLSP